MALFNQMSQQKNDVSMSNLGKRAQNLNAERIIEIDLDKIDDMAENADVFGYDEEEISHLMKEIQTNGFHDPITVSPKENNRYTCISGHQRKVAMKNLGYTKIQCYVAKGLTEQQERDLWRSANIIQRKLTPYNYAKLIQSYMDDFTKYKMKGIKRTYAAEKCGIGDGSVPRYLNILKMPASIQERCKEQSFPYVALMAASKFDPDQLALLETRVNEWYQHHPNLAMERKDLEKIIAKTASDSQYEDTSKPDEALLEGNEKDAKDFVERSYRSYVDNLKKKTDGKYKAGQLVAADDALDTAAEAVFAVINSDNYAVLNRVKARSALRVLKEAAKKIESKMSD